MGDVIDLAKRKAWRDLKRMVSAGMIKAPDFRPPAPVPQTDAGIAMAYMVEWLPRS